MRRVDSFTEPGRMSQPEALEFLGNLGADIEARMEALEAEMGEDEQEEDEDDGA